MIISLLRKNFFLLITLISCTLISSCRSESRSVNKSQSFKEVAVNKDSNIIDSAKVKMYFENSGSMRGYVGSGTSDFKASFGNLIVELDDDYNQNLEIFLVNDNIEKKSLGNNVRDFAKNLDITTFNGGTSLLEKMLTQILDSTDNKTVSIFVSDCIFSIGGAESAEEGLDHVKSLLKGALYKINGSMKSEGFDFSAMIFQSDAEYDGIYYNRTDDKTNLTNVRRPYYTIVMGNSIILEDFRKARTINRYFPVENGFKHMVEFNTIDYTGQFDLDSKESKYWSVLGSTLKEGNFKPVRKKGDSRIVEIEGVKVSRRSSETTFQCGLIMDLSSLPVEEEYKINLENYEINESYTLTEVIPIEDLKKINPTDLKMIKNQGGEFKGTHVFIIQSKEKSFPSVNLKMKRVMPQSFRNSYGGTEEDDNISAHLNTTFGLKYLMEGFDEGFRKERENSGLYFNITIPVSAGTASSGGWLIWVAILIILGGIVLIYLKNKRR